MLRYKVMHSITFPRVCECDSCQYLQPGSHARLQSHAAAAAAILGMVCLIHLSAGLITRLTLARS